MNLFCFVAIVVLNLSSRNCELIIGSQNWTPWIDASSGIQVGYPEYEMGSGLMPVEGSITLKYSIYDPNLPSNPNYFLNPSQWKRGQTVSIRIVNIAGTLTYLPCSGQLLYLLRPTQRPKVEMDGIATLVLNIGCRLALDNFPPEPNRNVAGVVAGVSTNRNTIIGNILDYISVPHSIGSLPYPIDYPLPKTDGNWISFAGAIADSAGYYLRCNTSGTVIAEPISLDPSAAIETYVISADEKVWEPSGDSAENPLEKLILSSIKQNVNPNISDTTPEIIEERAPLSKISSFPDYQSLTVLVPSKRTTISQSLNSTRFIKTEEIREPLSTVCTFPDYRSLYLLVPSKETTIFYLLKDGIVYRQVEQIREPLCNVCSFRDYRSLYFLVPSKITTTDWVKTGDKLWTKTGKTFEPLCNVSKERDFQSLYQLVESGRLVNNRDTNGPPTDIGETSLNTISEENLTVTVYAQQLAEDPFRERQRTVNVPYVMSSEQLSAYGDRFNKLLTGRSLGFQFGGELTDITLSSDFKPFAQVAVQEGDVIYYPKIDAIQYALNLTECYVLWNGIIVGSAPIANPDDIARPMNVPFGRAIANLSMTGSVLNDAIRIQESNLSMTGSVWNTNILPDRANLSMTGSILNESAPPPTGLVAKTITYFACEEASGVRNSSHIDSFVFSWSGSGFALSTSGAVGDGIDLTTGFSPNGFRVNGSLLEETFSLNEIPFIAYAFAFSFVTLPVGVTPLFESAQLNIEYDSGNIKLVVFDDTFTASTLTYSVALSSLDPSNVTDWHLIIATVNTSTGEMSLQMNNMDIETATCPTLGNFASWSETPRNVYMDWIIDEFGVFNADLDTSDRNTLWNSGDFNTYTNW